MSDWQLINPDRLQVARKFLGLQDGFATLDAKRPTDDAVFVAIDFEQYSNFCQEDLPTNLNCEAGLAILDPRTITTSPPKRSIKTTNIVSGTEKYCVKADKDFIFSKSLVIDRKDMLRSITSAIPSSRKIILVGHHITGDLTILQALGFDFEPVIAIIDTLWVATKAGRPAASLKNYLLAEGCIFDRFHCAGNDANFTLRLLLVLACRIQVADPLSPAEPPLDELRSKVEAIAQSPIQKKADPQAKAAKKRMKRLQRSRKYQSKFWDLDKQNEIRAERAAKK